jgi:hypothetical protein
LVFSPRLHPSTDMLDHLAFWYQVILASEALLRDAIHILDTMEGGEFERELRNFYAEHLEDERDHAAWLREDLGGHPVNLHFGAAQLAGMAYYLVRHLHPVALMGYMQALECTPIPMDYVEAVEREHGKDAARTLRHHAEEDPNHAKELEAFPIPGEWRALVESTRKQTRLIVETTYV